ncbi:helix-turn-helix domain-containing protein [Clostridium kluyveri]|uniref:HTH cro/C1-type domain-containing protein n=1 Tax=Clostridium kluyveri TaxID=1534 RepID=A0A1L5FEC9_CLOKL|nr:helix-turn-helix transcriptional regulator [Clostridium kluyveri]APM41355.1 hypothetical protein BS101_21840 [Clostridium kluyveri]
MFRAIRNKLGITQKQMAERLGISQSYLSKLENTSLYKMNYISIPFIKKTCNEFTMCPIMLFLYFYEGQFYCPFYSKKKK